MAGTPHAPLPLSFISARIRLISFRTWQTLHLRAADTERLLGLARDYLPRYGSKVKILVLTWWTRDDLRYLSRTSRTSEIQQVLAAAESFTGLESASVPTLPEICALQDALTATILQACSNLLDLTVLQHTNTMTNFVNPDGTEVEFHLWKTQVALAGIGGRITAAGLSFGGSNTDLFLAVIRPLNLSPNIEHFHIRILDESFDRLMRALIDSISELRKLVSFELDTASLAAWRQLQINPPKNMTQLILSGVRDLQLTQLAAVLTAAPIVSLCLRHLSVAHFQFPSQRADNLRIENLSIAGCTASKLPDFFDSAPLKSVEFCANSRGRSDRINPKRLQAFIMQHRTTLLSFKIHWTLLAPSAKVSGINHALEREGISVRVKTFR